MTKEEFALINRLASQLQHFHNQDNGQASPVEVALLLDEAHKTVMDARPDIITQLCTDKFVDQIATRDEGGPG